MPDAEGPQLCCSVHRGPTERFCGSGLAQGLPVCDLWPEQSEKVVTFGVFFQGVTTFWFYVIPLWVCWYFEISSKRISSGYSK